MVKSIVIGSQVIIVSQIIDLKNMTIQDFIKLRINNPEIYWHFAFKGLIPDEVLYSVEIEFDD